MTQIKVQPNFEYGSLPEDKRKDVVETFICFILAFTFSS